MIKKTIKMLVFAAIAVLLVSCSSYPTELVGTATKAVTELSAVQPEVYASEAFATLNDSLKGAIAVADEQKGKFLFHNYREANNQLNGVISYSEVVKTQAIEVKAKAKAEIVTLLSEIKALNDENVALLAKAPNGKDERAAVLAIKNDIATIATEYEFVNSQLEVSGNLLELLDRAKAIKEKAVSINQELKTAISDIG